MLTCVRLFPAYSDIISQFRVSFSGKEKHFQNEKKTISTNITFRRSQVLNGSPENIDVIDFLFLLPTESEFTFHIDARMNYYYYFHRGSCKLKTVSSAEHGIHSLKYFDVVWVKVTLGYLCTVSEKGFFVVL